MIPKPQKCSLSGSFGALPSPQPEPGAERRQMASSTRTRVRAATAGPSQAAGSRAPADDVPIGAGTWPPSGTLTALLPNTRRGSQQPEHEGAVPKDAR